jgi:sugar phosphate isomerase/epimerase
MHRRAFLTTAIAGLGTAAIGSRAAAQTPAATAKPSGDIPAAAVAAGQGPAPVAPEKLGRIGIMTLNHSSILKLPWDTTPNPARTLALLDVPRYYLDNYGVTNIEFQHSHLAQGTSDPDPELLKALKAKLDAAGARANQINLEIGQITQLSTAELRDAWLARARKWADAAPLLGATRLLVNQTGLSDANKADAIAAWKAFQDYARPKGIKIAAENRPFSSTAYGPPADYPNRSRVVWGLLEECARAAGGYTNIDFGRTGRFLSQQELHDAIRGMVQTNSGNVHVKTSPHWDLGTAVRLTESLDFKGLYSIEVDQDPAVRVVYNIVLANLSS